MKTEAEIYAEARKYAEECAQGKHGLRRMIMAILNEAALINERVRTETVNASTGELAGSLRKAPPIPVVDYRQVPHPVLKQSVTQAAEPGFVGEAGRAWQTVGERMIEFQTSFAKAIDDSKGEWQGKAGDRARSFLVRVGDYIGKAGAGAKLAGTQAAEHSEALQRVRDSMPDPVDFDEAAALADLERTIDPDEFVRKLAEYEPMANAKKAAHDEAARLATVFDQSISGASTLPAFPPPPAFETGDDRDPDGNGRGGGGGVRPPGGTADLRPPGPSDEVQLVSRQGDDGGADGRLVEPVPRVRPEELQTPGQTDLSRASRTPVDVGGLGGPGGGAPGGGAPGGGLPPVGGFGAVGSGGAGSGSGGAMRGDRGTGGGRGFGPYGSPGSGAGTRGGAPANGFGGAGRQGGRGGGFGGVPMGAGAGRGDEDLEHQRPEYLIEADPEGVFGTDEPTAPPVIGA